jgi:predicted ATPase
VLDILSQLVEKSLIVVDRGHSSPFRYRYLETIRQFLSEKPAAPQEVEALRNKHLEYFLPIAHYRTDGFTGAGGTLYQAAWLAIFQSDMQAGSSLLEQSRATFERLQPAGMARRIQSTWLLNNRLSLIFR